MLDAQSTNVNNRNNIYRSALFKSTLTILQLEYSCVRMLCSQLRALNCCYGQIIVNIHN